MRIGINCTGLYPGKVGGIEQYIRNIVSGILHYSDMSIFLFLNDDGYETFESNKNLKTIKIDMSYNNISQLQGYIDYYKIDVYFCPMFHLIPQNPKIPCVSTILDLQQEFYPENFSEDVLKNRKKLTDITATNSDMILTISEYSKKTIIDKYGIDDDKIVVTYLDADSSFNNPLDDYKFFQFKRKLPSNFILFPANMWPHKNHISLLRGFIEAKKKHLDLASLKLVFTGSIERETDEINKFINDNDIRYEIMYLGYVDQDDMQYIFSLANMLAFPSKFEGFGIPLVEAMAVGTPIICSKSSCLPEIGGDAVIYFDEDNPNDIAEAIYNVYSNQELRNALIEKGKERRKIFSWDRCVSDTIRVIRNLYKEPALVSPTISSKPLVSIVTPSYNQGEFIRETIESVLNQSYENIEYIVMDGGSTDNTVDILKEYSGRIKWFSEKDAGQADAVNKGIKIAKGEIIGWLNSDDTYYPDAVKIAVEELQSHPDVDMIYGEGNYIDRESNVTTRYPTKLYDYNTLAEECFICQPTAFFTKGVVNKVGGLRADLQLCMDYELWMRIGKVGKIMYVPKLIATSRMYEDNKTLSRRWEVYNECCREVKKCYGYVPNNWLVGYADFIYHMHPIIPIKYYHIALFIRYNFSNYNYFVCCIKKYFQKKKKFYLNNKKDLEVKCISSNNNLFPDGWMSKRYDISLKNEYKYNRIIIKGEHLFNFGEPVNLIIKFNNQSIVLCIEKLGKFQLSADLPVINKDMYKLVIVSDKTFIPAKSSNSTDERELSVKIDEIYLEERRVGKLPLVSIVTPSYNQGEFLRATIESVLSQDYPYVEYIVIDGGSTDNTLDILKEYYNKLKYVSEKDFGQSNAINKGFKMARGEIVAWLNSDDVYEPGCISAAVEEFMNNPNISLVYGDGYIIDRKGKKCKIFEYTNPFDMWGLRYVWDYIMQPTTFFRASSLRNVGYLDEKLNWTMDWDLWVKLSDDYDVKYIPSIMACSREYGENKTSQGHDKRLKEIANLMNRFTGEDNPYGYEIYYLSNLLATQELNVERDMEVRNRLSSLIELQPIPDRNGCCQSKVNFLIPKYKKFTFLYINVLRKDTLHAKFYWNNDLWMEKDLIFGEDMILLPPRTGNKADYMFITIESDALKSISSRADSWVKMELQ